MFTLVLSIGILNCLLYCSGSLLSCSDTFCANDNQAISWVNPDTYVQYVCATSDGASLLWEVSTAETRSFLIVDSIGATSVSNNNFFYTLISNSVSLTSSLSFRVFDNLNGTVINCTDQSTLEENTITMLILGPPPKVENVVINHKCSDNFVTVTWDAISSEYFLSHYNLTVTKNNEMVPNIPETEQTSMNINDVSPNDIITVSVVAVDRTNRVGVMSDTVIYSVTAPSNTNGSYNIIEASDKVSVFVYWTRDISNRPSTQNYNVTWAVNNITYKISTEELYYYFTIDRNNDSNLIVKVNVFAINCIGNTGILSEMFYVTNEQMSNSSLSGANSTNPANSIDSCPTPSPRAACTYRDWLIAVIIIAIILFLIIVLLVMIIIGLVLKKQSNKQDNNTELENMKH